MSLHAPLYAMLDFLFPSFCLLCGGSFLFTSREFLPLCPDCFHALRPLEGIRCCVCGVPLISEHGICIRCRERQFSFETNHSIFAYGGAAKMLLRLYKFQGKKELACVFALLVQQYLRRSLPGIPLVPVPFRKKSRKKRGWDHILAITSILRRKYDIPVLDILSRKDTLPQKTLKYAERISHLKGNIAIKPNAGTIPGHIVLFDDVFTTGATVSECSAVLKQHGVVRISVLTLAMD